MENIIRIEVTLDQLNIILSGLAKLPLETSLETFTTVRQQGNQQVQFASAPIEAPKTTEKSSK